MTSLDTGIQAALPRGWRSALKPELTRPYWENVRTFLGKAKAEHKVIYPSEENVFAALQLTPFDQVKVVILGQDPYHGPNQAHGLSFSVPRGERLPPSLRNIFKELQADLGIKAPKNGDLSHWAEQGVLLLNTSLTVEQGQAGSHAKIGWEAFTDDVIAKLSRERDGLVFVLWGAHAQKKEALIDTKKHYVLKSVHPSPLSASRGFFGSKPFSKINAYLTSHGQTPIDWQLPE